MAAAGPYTPVVHRLGCLRGVSTLAAFGLAVEIGDWNRLSGRRIGAYLRLVPTESSSGATRSQGEITKTGNGPAAADRSGLAPPRPPRDGVAAALGSGEPGGAGPRSGRQPPVAHPLVKLRRPQETPRGGQLRDHPRTRRLVLVAGRPREGLRVAVMRARATLPRGPSVCQCSSAATSFMLAALRVLHVAPSHAPAYHPPRRSSKGGCT